MLEIYFPPFFTISVHFTIHLAREARLAGPVHFRWMYTFERYTKILEGYVKNRARSEGCIVECYRAEEQVLFCSAYIKKVACIGVHSRRNDDIEGGLVQGREISHGVEKQLDDHVLQVAHRYVLFNIAEIKPYLKMHIEELKQANCRLSCNDTLLQKQHMETWLAHGPRKHVTSYTGYIINGHQFHTTEIVRLTQDSGVSIEVDTLC